MSDTDLKIIAQGLLPSSLVRDRAEGRAALARVEEDMAAKDATLATLATLARATSVTVRAMRHGGIPYELSALEEALDLPAVRDVLTTDRAHAARVSGEGDE